MHGHQHRHPGPLATKESGLLATDAAYCQATWTGAPGSSTNDRTKTGAHWITSHQGDRPTSHHNQELTGSSTKGMSRQTGHQWVRPTDRRHGLLARKQTRATVHQQMTHSPLLIKKATVERKWDTGPIRLAAEDIEQRNVDNVVEERDSKDPKGDKVPLMKNCI